MIETWKQKSNLGRYDCLSVSCRRSLLNHSGSLSSKKKVHIIRFRTLGISATLSQNCEIANNFSWTAGCCTIQYIYLVHVWCSLKYLMGYLNDSIHYPILIKDQKVFWSPYRTLLQTNRSIFVAFACSSQTQEYMKLKWKTK